MKAKQSITMKTIEINNEDNQGNCEAKLIITGFYFQFIVLLA